MRATWSSVLALAALTACGPTAPADDAGARPDAGAVEACVDDADCDDSLYCTGAERCVDSVCEPGVPIDCSDAVTCTVDRCDEVRRLCTNVVPDLDGDGAGDAACLGRDGAPLGRDCDDTDPRRFIGNVERCDANGFDEDCDPSTFGAEDLDGDGALSARCCNGATCGSDCDDTRASVRPGASEICNGFDDDCDGTVDEGVGVMGYPDLDADGRGDDRVAQQLGCPGQVRFTQLAGDCDDSDPTRNVAQAEFCDEVDNDCDEVVDEETQAVPWYEDSDGDRYGAVDGESRVACEVQPGFSVLGTDCDDSNPAVSPVAAEACNGLDDDCNGAADFVIATNDLEDDDNDGAVDFQCGGAANDCDDNDPRTRAGSSEICDGRDNDCDEAVDEDASQGVFYRDVDGDGFGSERSGAMVSCQPIAGYVPRAGDCDDGEPAVHPGAADVCNGVDDDCDGRLDQGAAASCGPGAICDQGACRLDCVAGRADCDTMAANGCEIDVTSDVEHCGACGVSCGVAGVCDAGVCDEVRALGLGAEFSCVLRRDAVVCWGDNTVGQLGTGAGTPPMSATPVEVSLPFVPTQLAVGSRHVCVLSPTRAVWCWGDNSHGQLSRTAPMPGMPAPAELLFVSGIRRLAAGGEHNCVEGDLGGVACWGRGSGGQIGDPSLPDSSPSPHFVDPQVLGPTAIRTLALGLNHSCLGNDDGVFCWGANDLGQLGQGSTGSPMADPVFVPGTGPLRDLAVGGGHACAIDPPSHELYCWGANGARQASGTTGAGLEALLVRVGPLALASSVSVGLEHTVFVDLGGGARSFGANSHGELGDGTFTNRSIHGPVFGALAAQVVGTGPSANHHCVSRPGGGVFCWGNNSRGQLGSGGTDPSYSTPQQVVGL